MGVQDTSKPREPSGAVEPICFSNGIRLTAREWLFVVLFAAALIVFAPSLWQTLEPFPLEADYRIPHDLSNDYWLYERFAGLAAEHGDILVRRRFGRRRTRHARANTVSFPRALGGKEAATLTSAWTVRIRWRWAAWSKITQAGWRARASSWNAIPCG